MAARARLAVVAIVVVSSFGCYGLDNGLALTPIMGWNTWDHFRCSGGTTNPGLGHACNAVSDCMLEGTEQPASSNACSASLCRWS